MLGSSQYEERIETIIEVRIWAGTFAELEPSLVAEARMEAPKEIWEGTYVLGTMNGWKWKVSDLED